MVSPRSSTGKVKAVARRPGRPRSDDTGRSSVNLKEKILAAAQMEFAERGFKLTTIRNIAERGDFNVALISYYFGSKQQLYDDVVDACTMHLNYPRLRMLDELEAKSGPEGPALADVLGIFISTFRPVLSDPHSQAAVYLRFFGRIYTEPAPEVLNVIERKFSTIRQRFLAAVGRAVPQIPRQDLALRFSCMIGALLYVSANPATIASVSGGVLTTSNPDAFWDDFVGTWCRMFASPIGHHHDSTSKPVGAKAHGQRQKS